MSTEPSSKPARGLSRFQLLAAAAAGVIGGATAPVLGGLGRADASGLTEEDASNFVAEGPSPPSGVGFDATATDNLGNSVFTVGASGVGASIGLSGNGGNAGVHAVGANYGVLAASPTVGVRGGGDNNSTGVIGISFTDSTEQTHGSGTGVQGNSGTGSGVAGYSESGTGVYGDGGATGVGVSGTGATGLHGASSSGTGVVATSADGTGLAATGSKYGVTASSPGVGIRGGGDENSTGVMGISFTDATEKTHGGGNGVQGNSGNGFGVAGYSDFNAGVYGSAGGVSGIGISGQGVTGVQGISTTGTGSGVIGSSGSGTGVLGQSTSGTGVMAKSTQASALTATSASLDQPAILAQNTAVVPKKSLDQGTAAGGMRGESAHSYGVLGTTSAKPGRFTTGVGVAGWHVNGNGAGVAGYSLAKESAPGDAIVPEATGVFGVGDFTGVSGQSGKQGVGIRGVNTAAKTGILGLTFTDETQNTLSHGTGVQGNSGSGTGVAGFSTKGTGVYGQSEVVGVSGNGREVGVAGSSDNGGGIVGRTKSGSGVTGQAKSGIGVVATSGGHTQPALYAVNKGSGPAISATGVTGYGAELDGALAPVRLIPHALSGAPRSGKHLTGELVVDSSGNLYLCIDSGTPGTWRRVVLA